MCKTITILTLFALIIAGTAVYGQSEKDGRIIQLLDTNWKFINTEVEKAEQPGLNTDSWQTVEVPHDWAISGKFDESIDMQVVQVVEDGEKVAKKRSGRTGGLPHIGIGWYRKSLDIPASWKGKRIFAEFDGAMSHANIYLNGQFIGEWPYGYASFGFELTDKIIFGKANLLAVRLENKPFSSRWYPGAGLYRNVRLVATSQVLVKQWGTYITTPDIEAGKGSVKIETSLDGIKAGSKNIKLTTNIYDRKNQLVATVSNPVNGNKMLQKLVVDQPNLWSGGDPYLYKAVSIVDVDGKMTDRYETVFGFRYVKFTKNDGFFLNGKNMKLKGVCMHHDLGALGAAINVSAIRRQLTVLQEMGCNAIRTSHNPPAPELLQLCNEMGFMVIDEAFDEWKNPKCENGYNTLWDKWAEKDMVSFIHRDRNNPSVIMWSIGNEIREQSIKGGDVICKFLVDICKREDPTRPTTAGFNQWQDAIKNGLADIVDVPAWNYKPQFYKFIHANHPDWTMYASETASTVSSRGEYFFPAVAQVIKARVPYQCSSYDMEYPGWATSPDTEFAAQDSFPFMGGEFVWTGFDYLGEPTPFNDVWPSRSSYFGIIDLAGIPKDRFYLYKSKWTNQEVLHLLPHWNWKGMEGKPVPVHCYTSFQKAELFVNGKSMGIRQKDPAKLYTKFRLVWENVIYEPGELKVVALDANNKPIRETITRTAGNPFRIILNADRKSVSNSGKELAFVTITIVDDKGVICPRASNKITLNVTGAGKMRAADNGDATCLESFIDPVRSAFNGKCMAIIQANASKGNMKLIATSPGLAEAEVSIQIEK
jgi:beta-galactosidase